MAAVNRGGQALGERGGAQQATQSFNCGWALHSEPPGEGRGSTAITRARGGHLGGEVAAVTQNRHLVEGQVRARLGPRHTVTSKDKAY